MVIRSLEKVVKALLKILLGGFVVFMLLAIGQEWEFFSEAWFGAGEEKTTASDSDQQEASQAVSLMLNLMRHFYASGGDPRFADRMPASDGILQEMRSDIDYLATCVLERRTMTDKTGELLK